jgi:hypothetical protein
MSAPLYLLYRPEPGTPLTRAILEAADRLHAREHVIATVALVNPVDLAAAGDIAIDGIAIKAVAYVTKKHVMVGVEDKHKLISLAQVVMVEAAEQGRLL